MTKISSMLNEFFAPIGGEFPILTSIGTKMYRYRLNKYLKDELNESFVDITEGISGEVKGKISASDNASFAYKFRNNRPQGVIITDTYNHPVFPINYPRIDNSKIMLFKLQLQFKELYSKMSTMFLPWHYTIEMVDGRYVIYNTRPIDIVFPLNNSDAIKFAKDSNTKLNSKTKQFYKENFLDIQECIHICIIGDTSSDIYPDKIYKLIGRYCVHPMLYLFKLPKSIGTSVHLLNIGDKFKGDLLESYIKK